MSKKRWEDETLKPTLEKYPERKETLLDERDILNTPEDVNDSETEFSNACTTSTDRSSEV